MIKIFIPPSWRVSPPDIHELSLFTQSTLYYLHLQRIGKVLQEIRYFFQKKTPGAGKAATFYPIVQFLIICRFDSSEPADRYLKNSVEASSGRGNADVVKIV